MRWVECGAFAAVLLAGIAHADSPGYGKVDTFQPGKKYNCVPTADHKGWDCNESGKSSQAHAEPATPTSNAPNASATSESAPKASALPSYLTNAAASGRTRGAAPASAPVQAPAPEQSAPAPEKPVPAPEKANPAPDRSALAQEPRPARAPTREPAPAAPQVADRPASAPPAPPAAAQPAPSAAIAARGETAGALGNRQFLALPGSSYIVEIAHSANRADLAALRPSLHLPLGELYELHLSRDGGDWWLLVWGHFSDIESARAARSDLPADAAINAGWPRRIAPLQAEARRFSD